MKHLAVPVVCTMDETSFKFILKVTVLLLYLFVSPTGSVTPLPMPSFTSGWLPVQSQAGDNSFMSIPHYLNELPIFVQVLTRAVDGPNVGLIFHGTGSAQVDEDLDEDYGGVVYSYNKDNVRLWLPTQRNQFARGCAINTGGPLWGTPHYQCSNSAEVKVDAWLSDNFPAPDYTSDWFPFSARDGYNSFKEIDHALQKQPSLVRVQYQDQNPAADFDGYTYDGYGAAQSGDDINWRHHGGIVYSFDESSVRMWAPSINDQTSVDDYVGSLFVCNDGWGNEIYANTFNDGMVKVFVWTDSFPTPYEISGEMGNGNGVENYWEIPVPVGMTPEFVFVEVKAKDGPNTGFTFYGMGVQQSRLNANYGGLIYGYNASHIRMWSPDESYGGIVNVIDGWGGETYAQTSQTADVTVKMWQTEATDPCHESNYIEVDNRYRSSTFSSSHFSDVSRLICDNDTRVAWYRFTSEAGGEIPTSCVAEGMCGTQYPVWINGAIPEGDGISAVTACVNKGACCDDTVYIKVKRCSDYIVYELKPFLTCPTAYCAGDREPCPPGQRSPTGDFQPDCTDAFPQLKSPPLLEHKFDDNIAYFECNFEFPMWQNTSYLVDWYLDENRVNYKYLGYKERSDNLMENEYKLGSTVTCEVSAKYMGTEIYGYPLQSNAIFVGVQVLPNDVTVSENELPSNVSITTTVAMRCSFYLRARENYYGLSRPDVAFDKCQVDYGYQDGANIVSLYAVSDCQSETFYVNVVDIIPTGDCSLSVMDGYAQSFDVNTEELDCGNCCGTGDPHYTTFDASLYDWYGLGEFVLHQSLSRQFEVHVRTWPCNAVTCHCAIAVRENNDVISVDICHGTYGRAAPRITKLSNGKLASGVRVKKDKTGKEFVIGMPSMSSVRVVTTSAYINVYLDVPGADFDLSNGLCGTFDHNKTNDYRKSDGTTLAYTGRRPDEFSESWRIPSGESLFDKQPDNLSILEKDTVYCDCRGSEFNCYENMQEILDYSDYEAGWTDITDEIDAQTVTGKRPRRQVQLHRKVRQYSATDNHDFTPATLTWPTPSGRTEQQARDMCESAVLNSTAAEACAEVPGVDLFLGVESCVEDIGVSDSLMFLDDAVSLMENQCVDLAMKNLSLYTTDANGTVIGPPSFVYEVICPSQCSGQGLCVNGTCECYQGFDGADCSIDTTRPPNLWYINDAEEHALCDIREEPCQHISVIGENFLNSDGLICLYSEIQDHLPTESYFATFREVICSLENPMVVPGDPDVTEGVTVQTVEMFVSNDNGITSSNGLLLTTYDSKCQYCNETFFCELKSDSCEINGHCFSSGESNPNDDTKYCNPSINQYEWTEIADPNSGNENWVMILALTLCGIAGIILATILIVVVYKHVCKKKHLENKVHPKQSSYQDTVVVETKAI